MELATWVEWTGMKPCVTLVWRWLSERVRLFAQSPYTFLIIVLHQLSMKTRPFEDWLAINATPEDVIYYGFDPTEKSRIQRRSSHLAGMGFRTDYPLAFWGQRTIFSTDEIGIARPNTYELFKHGNCVGCLKAGRQHWYVVYCTRQDRWEKAKFAEEEIGYTIIKGISLEDLEPMFDRMKQLGIEPTEHIQAATFWARVKKLLKVDPNMELFEEEDTKPCECAV